MTGEIVRVERLGGIAGFGGPNLKSEGDVDLASLAPADRASTRQLFDQVAPQAEGVADGFHYRLTRADGESVEVPESAVPQAVRDSVEDRLA